MKTITAKTPETLARTLGLGGAESQVWQLHHALLKRLRQIVADKGLTHAELARMAALGYKFTSAGGFGIQSGPVLIPPVSSPCDCAQYAGRYPNPDRCLLPLL